MADGIRFTIGGKLGASYRGALAQAEGEAIASGNRIQAAQIAQARETNALINAEQLAMARANPLRAGEAVVAGRMLSQAYNPDWLKRNAEEKAKQETERAMEDMAAGSGGYNWLKTGEEIAGASAAGGAGMAAVNKVKKMGEAAEEVTHAAHGNATVLRESAVMLREASRGNWSRMLGSFSIWIQAVGNTIRSWPVIGHVIGAINAIGEIPGIAFAVKKLLLPVGAVLDSLQIFRTGREFFRMRAAQKEEKQSTRDVESRDRDVAERERRKVAELNHAGLLDDKAANELLERLKDPTNENVRSVLDVINPLQKNGTAEDLDKQVTKQRELNRLAEEHQRKLAQFRHEDADAQGRYNDDLMEVIRIKDRMEYMDKNSVEYAQALLELDDAQRTAAKDRIEVYKARNEKAEELKRAKEGLDYLPKLDVEMTDWERAGLSGSAGPGVALVTISAAQLAELKAIRGALKNKPPSIPGGGRDVIF